MAAGMDGGLVDGGAVPSSAAPSAVPGEPARERPRRGLALLLALSAGWGALFSYSLTYLSDDHPSRPASAVEAARASHTDSGAFEVASVLAARPSPVQVAVAPEAAPSAAPAGGPVSRSVPSLAEAEPTPRARIVSLRAEPLPVRPVAETAPAPAAASLGERAEFVGTWGPTGAACGARSRRRGYLPATITPEGARAGRTICNFREGHRTGNGWQMAAECSDRGRRWSSQVRLVVDGDRLTWTSGKGSSSYVRCGRRAG